MDDIQPPSRNKILIVRLSSIGDIVLTTPVVRAVKEQVPDVELHYLTKKQMKDVMVFNPHVDKLHLYDPEDVDATIQELKGEKFDFVVDLQGNHRSRQLVRKLRTPSSSFPKINFRKFLNVTLKLDVLPDQHIVSRYFEAVVGLDVHDDQKGLEFFIPTEGEFDEDDLPMVFDDGFVAVVLAGAHATKRIPASKVIEIGSILHKPVMLLGGKDVFEAGEEIVAALGDRAYNGCGKYSLFQSCSILKQSDAVITGDTGLMHIAAAFHKPIAVIWGNTVPEFGMYPYMPDERNLFRNYEVCPLSCRPCAKLGYNKCPRKHFKCMNNIPALEVAEWINKF